MRKSLISRQILIFSRFSALWGEKDSPLGLCRDK